MAVDKLQDFDKVIRDASASDKDKAIAIAWIMHLAGDIHQPLHTSARVTDLEPKGDQGGNLFLLTPPRERRARIKQTFTGSGTPSSGETCRSRATHANEITSSRLLAT